MSTLWRSAPELPGSHFFNDGFVNAREVTTTNPFGQIERILIDTSSTDYGQDGYFGRSTKYPMRMTNDDPLIAELGWQVELLGIRGKLIFTDVGYPSGGGWSITPGDAITNGILLDDVPDPASFPPESTYDDIIFGSDSGADPYWLIGASLSNPYHREISARAATVSFTDFSGTVVYDSIVTVVIDITAYMSNRTIKSDEEDDPGPQLFSPYLDFTLDINETFQEVSGGPPIGLGGRFSCPEPITTQIGVWTGPDGIPGQHPRDPSNTRFVEYDSTEFPVNQRRWNRFRVAMRNPLLENKLYFEQPCAFTNADDGGETPGTQYFEGNVFKLEVVRHRTRLRPL